MSFSATTRGIEDLRPLRFALLSPMITMRNSLMPKKTAHHGQLVMFPGTNTPDVVWSNGESLVAVEAKLAEPISERAFSRVPVVLSGSYRTDFEGLRTLYEELRDLGCDILSPSSVSAVDEIDGFVYMRGEETQAPASIEARHL